MGPHWAPFFKTPPNIKFIIFLKSTLFSDSNDILQPYVECTFEYVIGWHSIIIRVPLHEKYGTFPKIVRVYFFSIFCYQHAKFRKNPWEKNFGAQSFGQRPPPKKALGRSLNQRKLEVHMLHRSGVGFLSRDPVFPGSRVIFPGFISRKKWPGSRDFPVSLFTDMKRKNCVKSVKSIGLHQAGNIHSEDIISI